MKCLRMSHVNLRVENLAAAVKFYAEVLELEPVPRLDRGGKGAWFRLGTTEVHLAEDPTPQPRSKRHFAVEVENLAAARKDAERNGAEIDQEDTGRFWMRDPSGNRIEVVQRP